MSGHVEKRKMLDDEMSRFEAEISGPNSIDSSHPSMRPIIGANTFAQVKEQLKQANDNSSLQPPPAPPPSFPGNRPVIRPNQSASGPQGPQGPQGPHGPQGPQGPHVPFNMPFPDEHMGPQDCRPFGPRPGNFNQGPFRPPMNRPGPPNQPLPPPFGQNMGPGGPVNNPFPPPPPPPGFMGNHPGGGNNFPQNGMGPPPPPGFIPPQVNRANMNMGHHMMNNSGNMGPVNGPRPPPNLLRPPPPPPGLVGQRPPGPLGPQKGLASATISKGPTVISSAAKLLSASESKDKSKVEEVKTPAVKTVAAARAPGEAKKPASEPKKKKLKSEKEKEKANKKKADMTHAMEMAEKVKLTTTTVKQALQTVHPPQHQEEKRRERKPKRNLRYAGGQVWEDSNLAEWDPDDFRMFVGDLGNDVTEELLHRYFSHYPSFMKAKVVRDKRTNKSKGYGFISFKDSQDYIRAMKEMNGKYLGSRPIKLRKSMWKDRNLDIVQKKLKEKQLLGLK